MFSKNVLLATLAAISAVNAQVHQGFNYGAARTDGTVRVLEDFQKEFEAAQGLPGTGGKFTSARLYTMIQGGSPNDPISAIQAAINTDTTLLLGIWCSAGQEIVDNEITALLKAIEEYGEDFTKLVVGLSVGSEDLYRNSPMGIEAEAGLGSHPGTIASYIKQVRDAIKGTALEKVPIGHVDTWTVWVNASNSEVIDAVDWIGFDAYPYFQSTMANAIENARDLFWDAYDATEQATGKPVWITETGWPVGGEDMNLAKADVPSAQSYFNQIGCEILGKYPTWWYKLRSDDPITPDPSFGVLGKDFGKPKYDMSCKGVTVPPRGSSSSSSTSAPASRATTSSAEDSERTPGSTFNVVSTPTGSETEGAAATTGAGDNPSSASSIAATAFTYLGALAVAVAFIL